MLPTNRNERTAYAVSLVLCLALLPGCVLNWRGRRRDDRVPPPSSGKPAQDETLYDMTAEVISVKDIRSPKLTYIVEFKRVDGKGSPDTVRCLIGGGNAIFREMGGTEIWWWDFVYESGKNRIDKRFDIAYTAGDTERHEHYNCMRLVAWRVAGSRY